MNLYFIGLRANFCSGSKTAKELVQIFLTKGNKESLISYYSDNGYFSENPVVIINKLDQANHQIESFDNHSTAILKALLTSLFGAPQIIDKHERMDRLPLKFASEQFKGWKKEEAISNVFDRWVFAQHVKSSVTRGLNDARSGGKTILRLKTILDENGWQNAPGVTPTRPFPTQDRLLTALHWIDAAGLPR